MTIPTKGLTFTHKHFKDPQDCWKHLPIQEQPHAQMKVTMVTKTRVYYNYAFTPDMKGRWYMPRDFWQETYSADT